MSNILALPDELIYIIFNHLDGFSRIKLSKTCSRFQHFFINNSISQHEKFENRCSRNVNLIDVSKYLINNLKHIVSLDLGFINLVPKSMYVNLLHTLKNLKHLNVMETGLSIEDITPVINKNKTLVSLSITYYDLLPTKLEVNLKYLKFLMSARHYSKRVYLDWVSFKDVEELKFVGNSLNINYFFPVGILNSNIQDIYFEIKHDMKVFYRPFDIKEFVEYFTYRINSNFCVAVEYITGIYISEILLKEFPKSDNKFKIDAIENKPPTDVPISINFCDQTNILKMIKFKERIQKIISSQSLHVVNLYGSEFCPKNGFNILDYLQPYPYIKHLALQLCCLSSKNIAQDSSPNLVFKKRRISRIPTEDCPLKSITKLHTCVELLNIFDESDNHLCESEPMKMKENMVTSSYLESVLYFQNLKYLSLWNVPYVTTKALIQIFNHCKLLSTLSYYSQHVNVSTLRGLSTYLHLCKNMKTLLVESPISDINDFLLPLSKCNSLEVIDIHYPERLSTPSIYVEENIIFSLIEQIKTLCYISIINPYLMELAHVHKQNLKRLEKRLKETYQTIIVNLISEKYYSSQHVYLNQDFFNP